MLGHPIGFPLFFTSKHSKHFVLMFVESYQQLKDSFVQLPNHSTVLSQLSKCLTKLTKILLVSSHSELLVVNSLEAGWREMFNPIGMICCVT